MEHAAYEECWTCRRRRVQCDNSRIPCVKCEKAGLECFMQRPLRWIKGVAIRGNMQGRSFGSISKLSSAVTTKKNPSLKSSVYGDGLKFIDIPQGLPAELGDPLTSDVDPVTRYYVGYYNDRICNLLFVTDNEHNPFRSLVLVGLKEPVLQKAIVALAARHLANTYQTFRQVEKPRLPVYIKANCAALIFKQQAIEGLLRGLSADGQPKKDVYLASVLLLIVLDLHESGNGSWALHLKGAKSIVDPDRLLANSRDADRQGLAGAVEGIRDYLTKQIYLIETLGATFSFSPFPSSCPNDKVETEEAAQQTFLGCPQFLVSAIRFLCGERDSIALPEPINDTLVKSHIRETTFMLELIQDFDSSRWASNLVNPVSTLTGDNNSLFTLSQAYKLAALLFGQRVLAALVRDTQIQLSLVSDLLQVLETLRIDQPSFKCALWPIFVAGLECRSAAQREFLSECLEKFWMATHCVNAINAAKILQDYWQQEKGQESSSNWIFGIGNTARAWLFI